MDRKSNGHSANYLKRQARKIQRELCVPYLEALDIASVRANFTCWSNFINSCSKDIPIIQKVQSTRPQTPKPTVIGFHMMLSGTKALRPDLQMPVAFHKELGASLKIVRAATVFHKRACQPIKDILNLLDEWVHKEYAGSKELSDDVFFDLYFGSDDTNVEYKPSEERKQELIKLCRKAKAIITQNYHNCGPVRELLSKLDLSIKWLSIWPARRQSQLKKPTSSSISGGTLILIKDRKRPAIVIKHNTTTETIVCYSDAGLVKAGREEITVLRDQSKTKDFKPMRLWLPYGKWKCADGSEVLFSRDYSPIWRRKKDGNVVSLHPATKIEAEGRGEFFFDDASAPWRGNNYTFSKCISKLQDWCVEDRISDLMRLLPQAIATGNESVFKSSS